MLLMNLEAITPDRCNNSGEEFVRNIHDSYDVFELLIMIFNYYGQKVWISIIPNWMSANIVATSIQTELAYRNLNKQRKLYSLNYQHSLLCIIGSKDL